MTATSETAVKADSSEAQRLYQRGVAAARSGQKRVAAGLLTRSLQLDPRCEQAWLWLSGVIDDPHQQAFCLNAVLKLNPANQHAQRGMRLLEERRLLSGAPVAAPGLAEAAATPISTPAPERQESWWVGWRHRRRETSRLRLLLWAFPIVLVCLAIVLYESVALSVQRATAMPTPVAAAASAAPTAPALPTIEPILEAEPLAVVEGLSAGYLSAVDPLRAQLREATAAYREATSQPGGASVGHVAATQRLRASVEETMVAMEGLRPPATLQQAHDDYLRGLALQRDGLDALQEFYGSYQVANANRAALHFQQARAYIERAQAALAGEARQLAELSAVSSQTAR
jgi:hypothetical protein